MRRMECSSASSLVEPIIYVAKSPDDDSYEKNSFGEFSDRSVAAAGIEWDASQAHSAVYDTEKTAELFCHIANQWPHTPA